MVCKFHVALGAIGLTLFGASQVQAAPPNGTGRGITRMDHANRHAATSCGGDTFVITPQPGTDLMPFDTATMPPDVEAFYDHAARQQVTWLDTVECGKSNKTHASVSSAPNATAGSSYSANYSSNWSGW